MIEFDQKQIESLKGSYSIIARSCNVSSEYVKLLLRGQRNQNTKKARMIAEKAKTILDVLGETL